MPELISIPLLTPDPIPTNNLQSIRQDLADLPILDGGSGLNLLGGHRKSGSRGGECCNSGDRYVLDGDHDGVIW